MSWLEAREEISPPPFSPLAAEGGGESRRLDRVIARLARAREEYAREGAWSCLEDEPTPPTGGGGPSGPRPRSGQGLVHMPKSPMGTFVISVDTYGLRLRYAVPSQSRHPLSGWDGLRHSLGRSLMRMVEAATYLEHHSVAPSHMITLTLPPEAWEGLDRDEALERFKRARMLFLKALSARLLSLGFSSSYFWWLEIQKRGAPHIHLLLDLGGRLSPRDYEVWCAWVSAEWSRALGVEAPYATRFELLLYRDFRYLKAYVRKVNQKRLPFPGRWGKTYGLAGRWLGIVREARRSPRSLWRVGVEGVVRVIEGVVSALRAASAGVGEFVATADELTRWVRGLMPMYEVARAWAFGERVPIPDEVRSWRPFRVRLWWPEVLGSPRREGFLSGILLAISASLSSLT